MFAQDAEAAGAQTSASVANTKRTTNQHQTNQKVLVVANPANTNALMLIEHAPSIPPRNVTAMTRLDHNRALAQVAGRAGAKVTDVRNVIIWGNHSSTQVSGGGEEGEERGRGGRGRQG